MASGETEEEVEYFFLKIKKRLKEEPKLIIMDFSPHLISGTKKIFPNTPIGHDYFHTSKLLNKGMLKELSRIQKKEFLNIIAEYNQIQKLSIESEECLKLLKMDSSEPFLKSSITIYNYIYSIFTTKTLKEFNQNLSKFKNYIISIKIDYWDNILHEIEQKCPACGFTTKNFKKFGKLLCQKWRKYILIKRKEFETEKGKFSRGKYHILRNPKNMKSYHKKKLRKLLKQFPVLREYRQAIVNFHYQFNLKDSVHPSLKFLKKLIKKETHPRLCSAINTLIKEKVGIFIYRELLRKFPNLKKGKSIRSNHEQVNRKVNKVARDQFGFRSINGICIRLKGIIECPIIVSKSLLDTEV